MSDGFVKVVDAKTAINEIERKEGELLIMFDKEGCSFCKNMYPVIEEWGEEKRESVHDTHKPAEFSELIEQFELKASPTFVYFKDGKLTARIVGERSLDDLAEALSKGIIEKNKDGSGARKEKPLRMMNVVELKALAYDYIKRVEDIEREIGLRARN